MDVTAEGFGALAAELLAMAEEHCRGRILFVLEGGYDPRPAWREGRPIRSWAKRPGRNRRSGKIQPSSAVQTRTEIAPIIEIHRKYWPF